MLENNGCPPEQLYTLRNTVQNQDVKSIPPEDLTVENSKYLSPQTELCFPLSEKRVERRKEINRPRRTITFALDSNTTREFKIADIVQSDERVIKSGDRNEPKTTGRLVKLKQTDTREVDGSEDD